MIKELQSLKSLSSFIVLSMLCCEKTREDVATFLDTSSFKFLGKNYFLMPNSLMIAR